MAAAQERDVGKGVVRLDKRILSRLGLQGGGIIEITGKRSTVAIALPPYPEDEGLNIIRMDGLQRANANVSIGDSVDVRVADVNPARRITLAPAQKNIRLAGSGSALLRTLNQRPLVAGDVISTSIYQRSPGVDQGPFPEDIFSQFFQQRNFGLQEIRLMVTATTPRGVVQVTPETEIQLIPQYIEPDESRSTDVTYDDVGGLGDTIDQVREMIKLPLKHPELFDRLDIDPPKGVLLHGPPGTGKTLLAKAVAREAEANFIATKSSDLLSKWYRESEQQVSRLFARARQVAPTVIFLDEIDSLAPQRGGGMGEPAVTERVVNTLLAEMDGLEEMQGIVVIGATNRPTLLDPALLRPGRFDELLYVPVPETEGRLRILQIHTRTMPLAVDVDLESIAERTVRFTGADLENLVRRAGLLAIREDMQMETIPMRFFESALAQTHPSVTLQVEREYKRILEQLKSENPRGRRRLGFPISSDQGNGAQEREEEAELR